MMVVGLGTNGFAADEGSCSGRSAGFSDISDSRLSEMSEKLNTDETCSAYLRTKTDRKAYETGKPLCRGVSVTVEFGTCSPPSDISPCACEV